MPKPNPTAVVSGGERCLKYCRLPNHRAPAPGVPYPRPITRRPTCHRSPAAGRYFAARAGLGDDPGRRADRFGCAYSVCGRTIGAGLVIFDELDLEAVRLLEERRVHAGEVAPVGRLSGLRTSLGQALVRAVQVFGAEAQVSEVDVRFVGAAQLSRQFRCGSAVSAKPSNRLLRPCKTRWLSGPPSSSRLGGSGRCGRFQA